MTPEQYDAAIDTEFGADAAAVLAKYPLADFASPKDALARLVGDVEYVCEARRVARLIGRTKTPVFLYSFEYEMDPVVADRVVHGMEVPVMFGNNFSPPLFPPYALGPGDLALSHAMSGYWTRLTATGDPNSADENVVHWPAFTHPHGRGRGPDKYLVFDVAIGQSRRPRGAHCNFWKR